MVILNSVIEQFLYWIILNKMQRQDPDEYLNAYESELQPICKVWKLWKEILCILSNSVHHEWDAVGRIELGGQTSSNHAMKLTLIG